MEPKDQVFETPELLEAILLQIPPRYGQRNPPFKRLPPRDLLFASRVSRTWQATIEGSIAIQRKLCLQPSAMPPPEDTMPCNDLLSYHSFGHRSKDALPLLCSKTGLWRIIFFACVSREEIRLRLEKDDGVAHNDNDHTSRCHASWRRMHLCYGPKQLAVYYKNDRVGNEHELPQFVMEGNVTMEEVLERLDFFYKLDREEAE